MFRHFLKQPREPRSENEKDACGMGSAQLSSIVSNSRLSEPLPRIFRRSQPCGCTCRGTAPTSLVVYFFRTCPLVPGVPYRLAIFIFLQTLFHSEPFSRGVFSQRAFCSGRVRFERKEARELGSHRRRRTGSSFCFITVTNAEEAQE